MPSDKHNYKISPMDVVFVAMLFLIVSAIGVASYDKPEYDKDDLKKAEERYKDAEFAHQEALYDVMPEATHFSYTDSMYKKARDAEFDFDELRRQTKHLGISEGMAKRRQIRDSLRNVTDSIRTDLYNQYILSDSAYITTQQELLNATRHLGKVRADVRYTDSIAKIPLHKRIISNVHKMRTKSR